jgi:hypothetical protein
MTKTTRNQKDQLAKLMATENLTIVHRNIPTAYFDIKNRILACPTFKDDISNELYDLFMGHEVGHALHTPYEGVHSALEKNKTLKGYLNVVEDVRIESAIKERYQGLRKSFYAAYNELMEKDFFGIKNRDLQELSLIDKINLITKVGSRVQIQLTDEEQVFLDKCYACKTWEDVEAVATEIYEWSKENETRDETDENIVPQTLEIGGDEDEDEESESWGDEESEEGSEEQESSTGGGDSMPDLEDIDQGDSTGQEDSNETETELTDEEESKETGQKGGLGYGSYDPQDGARESVTEHAAHNNEGDYISDTVKITSQHDLGKVFSERKEDIDSIEVSYKQVLKDWDTHWSTTEDTSKDKQFARSKLAAKYLVDKNKKLVAHMAKEFDMKQTAQRSKLAYTGKTGKLDMNRLAKYQIVEDVFKKALYLPEGQNHGVNVLLDWSGSIVDQASDLIEQTIILAMFCRKVNIPHRMYLFSDSYMAGDDYWSYRSDYTSLLTVASDEMSNKEWTKMLECLGTKWTNFHFSKVSGRQVEKAIDEWNNLFGSVDMMDKEYSYYVHFDTHAGPRNYRLGGTPLDQSLVALRKLLPKFNSKYSIEKSILTIITDGYSHQGDLLQQTREEQDSVDSQRDNDMGWRTPMLRQLIDPYSKRVYDLSEHGGYSSNSFKTTQNLLEWISIECNVIVTGYFVLTKKRDLYDLLSHINPLLSYDDVWKEVRKTGYVLPCLGYNKLFITSASAIGVEGNDELSDDLVDAKKTRVMAAFKRNQKSKTTSRFLTNEFIKEIA